MASSCVLKIAFKTQMQFILVLLSCLFVFVGRMMSYFLP